jgi:hypothetical protein
MYENMFFSYNSPYPVVGCCECGDEPSGSGAMEFVSWSHIQTYHKNFSLNL